MSCPKFLVGHPWFDKLTMTFDKLTMTNVTLSQSKGGFPLNILME